MVKYFKGEWKKKKQEFLGWLKENQDAGKEEVQEAGYGRVLVKYYKGRINDVKKELEIPVGREYQKLFKDMKAEKVEGPVEEVAEEYGVELDTLKKYLTKHVKYEKITGVRHRRNGEKREKVKVPIREDVKELLRVMRKLGVKPDGKKVRNGSRNGGNGEAREYKGVIYQDLDGNLKELGWAPEGSQIGIPWVWAHIDTLDIEGTESVYDVVIGDVIKDSKYAGMKVGELWSNIMEKSKPVAVSHATTSAILDKVPGDFVFLGCGTGAGMREGDCGYDINKYVLEKAQEKGLKVEKTDFMGIDLSGFERICVPYVLQGMGENERKELYKKLQNTECVIFTFPDNHKDLKKEIRLNFIDREVRVVEVPVEFKYEGGISTSVGVGVIVNKLETPVEHWHEDTKRVGVYVEGEEVEQTIYRFRGLLKDTPIEYRETAIELLNGIVNKKLAVFDKDEQLVTQKRVPELVSSDIVELVKAYVK